MLAPGRVYVGDTKRIAMNYQDDDGTDIDPSSVVFKLLSPSGTLTQATYGTDAALVRQSAGDYYVDATFDESGRWTWRWVSTGIGTATAHEGTLVVQYSKIEEELGSSTGGTLVTPEAPEEIEELT